MKRIVCLAQASLMTACGEKRICKHGETEIPCGYYDLYTKLSELETQINVTSAENLYLPFEEQYSLREQWTNLYKTKKDSITEAFNQVGESLRLVGLWKCAYRKWTISRIKRYSAKN